MVQDLDSYLRRLTLGDAAENVAHRWFESRNKLSRASKVRWTSQEDSSAGFDFLVSSDLVFTEEELPGRNELCRVEVKGFSGVEPTDFFISRNEFDVMLKSKAEGYEYVVLLVRVDEAAENSGRVHSWLEKDALEMVDVRAMWSQAQVNLRDIPSSSKRLLASHVDPLQVPLPSSTSGPEPSCRLSWEQEQLRLAILASTVEAQQNDAALILLTTNLLGEGLMLHDVNNEGHCQFDAIALQIRRFQASYANLDGAAAYTYQQVRADLGSWLRGPDASGMECFLEPEAHGRDWGAFCDRVAGSEPGQGVLWGDHLTLIAAASKYERTVRVWLSAASSASSSEGGLGCRYVDIGGVGKGGAELCPDGREPLQIAHVYERHFMSVVPAREGGAGGCKRMEPKHPGQKARSKGRKAGRGRR